MLFMELDGHTAKITLFSYAAAHKKKIPSSPSVLQQIFFHVSFKVWGVFLQFFSLKIANLKNQICGGVWFKMEKPSDFVLCAEQEF